MPKTVSVHNGSAANREHNRRNPRTTGQMPHIQQDLVHHNETWIDIPVREAYKQIFQTAVDDYNRRQSRPERKIRDYYNQIRKSAKKHTAYELIIQIGDKNDTGLSADNEIACLREYYNNWQQRNPNLFLCGAYLHRDESTVHLHMDYIPVEHGYTRGMCIQNGLVRALGEQGFFKEGRQTAQILWEKRERQELERIARDHGIDIYHPDGEKRHHLDTEIYKLTQEISRQHIELDQNANDLKTGKQALDDVQNALSADRQEYTMLRQQFSNARRAIDVYEKLKQEYGSLQDSYRELQNQHNQLIQATTIIKGTSREEVPHRRSIVSGNYSVPEDEYKLLLSDHQIADTYRRELAKYQQQIERLAEKNQKLAESRDIYQDEHLYLREKLLEVNRYLNMVGLLDDYNDYHQEQERQRNADITEQISYDVSDRAENFAEWEPER